MHVSRASAGNRGDGQSGVKRKGGPFKNDWEGYFSLLTLFPVPGEGDSCPEQRAKDWQSGSIIEA